jgi:hypothetical protein
LGIPVKGSESRCTKLLKLLIDTYCYADRVAEECFKTSALGRESALDPCREARNYLYRLDVVLGIAIDNACVHGVEDLVEEVKMAIKEVERILGEAERRAGTTD